MSVLTDRWIKKMAIEKEMITAICFSEQKRVHKIFLMDCRLLVMMLEFLTNLKFLLM